MKISAIVVAAFTVSAVEGFAPSSSKMTMNNPPSSTALNMQQPKDNVKQNATASLIAATLVLGNVLTVGPAIAASMDDACDFGGSSQVVAARSGGRAGGRSSSYRSAPRPSGSSSSRTTTNTRVIERTRYVPSPSYSSPSIIMAPPIYNPLPGYGLGLGLNAINQIGNDMRDYRQEGEIRDARVQLEQARIREAEMEARLRALENGQSGQMTPQQLQMLQPQQLLQNQQQQQAVPSN